jgi:pyruvate-formate lyase-activating enzyme
VDRLFDYSSDLTVFLVSCGEASLEECRRRLSLQDCTFRLVEIADVTPMDRAFQAMLDQCQTPYFVEVDADMMLLPESVGQLHRRMLEHPESVAIHVGWLWGDAEERPIQGVKIYRHEVVKRYPFEASYSCEMGQVKGLKADGFEVVADAVPKDELHCLGVHWSLQTPERAFRRWERLIQKYRRYEWMSWLAPYPARLLERAQREPQSDMVFAAAMGAMAGLIGPLAPNQEDDASKPCDWGRVAGYMTPGPSEMVLYVTDRCNHQCPFCARTKGLETGSGDMLSGMVELALTTWPSISGVCVAGFGEPLMHPDLRSLTTPCLDRGRTVGLITNGALLSKKVHQLDKRLSYLSVSLNAATAQQHREATGVDTWESVLVGIRGALAEGMNCGISYVCTSQNLVHLPELLGLARELGVKFVTLSSVLPHGGDTPEFQKQALRGTDEQKATIAEAKQAPGAELVKRWPVMLEGPPRRACISPFRMIGMDATGWLTGCRRVLGPQENNGSIRWPNVWHGQHHVKLRRAMLGDTELSDHCSNCWACWEDY